MRRSRARVRNERQAREVAQPCRRGGESNVVSPSCLARVLPEEADQEPTEGRSSARRGGVAARADLSTPEAEALSVPASKSLQINGKSNPASFPPSSSASAESWASRESSRRSPVGIGRQRQPLKLLGKSVPVVLMEYAMPWKIVAEIAPTGEWSGRRGSNPRRSAWEADILPLNYSRFVELNY